MKIPQLAMLLALSACALHSPHITSAGQNEQSSSNIKCPPVAGSEVLWKPATRWVVVGELHGTREIPEVFAHLVCGAGGTGRPVVVGLERNEVEQPMLDSYLASQGSETDRAALLNFDAWQTGKDGRSSEGMLDLIEKLRRLKQSGRIAGVVAFQPNMRGSQAEREVAMAQRLMRASPSEATLVVALVGNVHAMKTKQTFGSNSFVPAAAHLPRGSTLTVDVRGNGGSAWNCSPECRAHYTPSRSPSTERSLVAAGEADERFDWILYLGAETTASSPAVGGTK